MRFGWEIPHAGDRDETPPKSALPSYPEAPPFGRMTRERDMTVSVRRALVMAT